MACMLFAILTSPLGGLGLGCLASHAWERWRMGAATAVTMNYRTSKGYRFIVLWVLISPLIWLGRTNFTAKLD